ncbi:MAG: dephospho-CoA kinase, partial [Rhodoferax sp.]
MSAVTRLGLTGGIGSGKSTVAQMLGDLGAAVIDADAIARSVAQPGGAAIGPIATEFGSAFITPEGALDRERMRELAFADAGAKRRLEAIIHPLVGQETQRQVDTAMQQGHRCIVFDIPLLVESRRWRQNLD